MLWAHKGTVCGFESHLRHWPTPDIFCSVILAVLPVLLTETERSDSMPKKKANLSTSLLSVIMTTGIFFCIKTR